MSSRAVVDVDGAVVCCKIHDVRGRCKANCNDEFIVLPADSRFRVPSGTRGVRTTKVTKQNWGKTNLLGLLCLLQVNAKGFYSVVNGDSSIAVAT